jgi:hypothetical protein
VYGDKTLKRTQIYKIMKKVKEGNLAMDQRSFIQRGASGIELSPPRWRMTGITL